MTTKNIIILIFTGLFVLQKILVFDVEVCYASEIIPSAINVAKFQLRKFNFQHIGSVGEITRTSLRGYMPIDLLMGGPPCNDLSAVNREPKDYFDVNGTALYVQHFVRILHILQKESKGHLLWLMENVASMRNGNQDFISRWSSFLLIKQIIYVIIAIPIS